MGISHQSTHLEHRYGFLGHCNFPLGRNPPSPEDMYLSKVRDTCTELAPSLCPICLLLSSLNRGHLFDGQFLQLFSKSMRTSSNVNTTVFQCFIYLCVRCAVIIVKKGVHHPPIISLEYLLLKEIGWGKWASPFEKISRIWFPDPYFTNMYIAIARTGHSSGYLWRNMEDVRKVELSFLTLSLTRCRRKHFWFPSLSVSESYTSRWLSLIADMPSLCCVTLIVMNVVRKQPKRC